MAKKKKSSGKIDLPLQHEGHKLRTRRDLLAQGYIGMSSIAVMPSLMTLLGSRIAYGAGECSPEATDSRNAAFLCFDLAGGANIAGSNVIVGKQGGQKDFLSSYAPLGLPNEMAPNNNMDESMGIAFHSDSALLAGIKAGIAAGNPNQADQDAILNNMDGAIFCTSSSDDTNNNPHNPCYWIYKAGAVGDLAALSGSVNSASGGRSAAPSESVIPTARPVLLRRPDSALGLVKIGKLAALLDRNKAERVLNTIQRLSEAQVEKFTQKDLPNQVRDVINCGYLNSRDFISKYDEEALDPNRDNMVTSIFPNMGNNNDQAQVGTIAKLVTDGFVGSGTLQLGGYDYHDGSRTTGERKDREAGELIGRSINLAAKKGRDLVVYVFTDGGVAAAQRADSTGKFVWRGDNGQIGAALMLVYKADGKPALRNEGYRQVGAYKDSGAVDNSINKISSDVTNLAKAVTANYLALHGKEGDLAKVVGDNPFGSSLNEYLIFNKLR